MKVLFLNHETILGGAELMLLRFLKYCNKNKFQCTLITMKEGPLKDEAKRIGIPVFLIEVPNNLLNIRRRSRTFSFSRIQMLQKPVKNLQDFIYSLSPDLIVSNSLKSHVLGSFALRNSSIPFAWRLHDIIDSKNFNFFQRQLLYYLARRYPKMILAVSNAAAEPLRNAHVPTKKLSVIYNGIEIEQACTNSFKADFCRNFGISNNDIVVTLPGRLVPMKGHEVIIKAAMEVIGRIPNVKFLLVGESYYPESDYKVKLQSLIESYRMHTSFVFVDFQSDMSSIYKISDIVVQLSILPDSLPTVILEAMAAKKIVIATNIGGAREIIDDKVDGFLIPPNDSQSLADLFLQILPDLSRYNNMRIRASDKIKEKYSINKYISNMEKMLENLVLN